MRSKPIAPIPNILKRYNRKLFQDMYGGKRRAFNFMIFLVTYWKWTSSSKKWTKTFSRTNRLRNRSYDENLFANSKNKIPNSRFVLLFILLSSCLRWELGDKARPVSTLVGPRKRTSTTLCPFVGTRHFLIVPTFLDSPVQDNVPLCDGIPIIIDPSCSRNVSTSLIARVVLLHIKS